MITLAELAAMTDADAAVAIQKEGERLVVAMSVGTTEQRTRAFGEALQLGKAVDDIIPMVVLGSVALALTVTCDEHEKRIAELERKLADLTAAKETRER
jgi:hypothetical protein